MRHKIQSRKSSGSNRLMCLKASQTYKHCTIFVILTGRILQSWKLFYEHLAGWCHVALPGSTLLIFRLCRKTLNLAQLFLKHNKPLNQSEHASTPPVYLVIFLTKDKSVSLCAFALHSSSDWYLKQHTPTNPATCIFLFIYLNAGLFSVSTSAMSVEPHVEPWPHSTSQLGLVRCGLLYCDHTQLWCSMVLQCHATSLLHRVKKSHVGREGQIYISRVSVPFWDRYWNSSTVSAVVSKLFLMILNPIREKSRTERMFIQNILLINHLGCKM